MDSDPKLVAACLEAGGDGVQGRVPGDGFEAAFTLGADAPEGSGEAGGVVLALQVPRDFAAEEALRDGVIGIALDLGCAIPRDLNQK